jgi:uncharacterized protein YutE (UPF0331/DUF86 family)
MFVTDTLRDQVKAFLTAMESRSRWLQQLSARSDAWWEDQTLRLAAERALHVAIECTTDVGNAIIDALIMREPGSYADIIQVLMEEKVVTTDWFASFQGAFKLREQLVHDYLQVEDADLSRGVQTLSVLFDDYADFIRLYLKL